MFFVALAGLPAWQWLAPDVLMPLVGLPALAMGRQGMCSWPAQRLVFPSRSSGHMLEVKCVLWCTTAESASVWVAAPFSLAAVGPRLWQHRWPG